jgi:L-arabinokinase
MSVWEERWQPLCEEWVIVAAHRQNRPSSSAALEVAALHAMAVAFGVSLEPRELALLCQKVENQVVGAPCGVMDQMTAACGRSHELLALLCQPAELQGTVAVPDDVRIWGIDSHVRHAVSGSDYGRVRVGAFMGARILEDRLGARPPAATWRTGRPRRWPPSWLRCPRRCPATTSCAATAAPRTR